MTKLAIVYYSATGHGEKMARRLAMAAENAGADVRVRHVRETVDPSVFANNPAWSAHYEATKDLPAATPDDLAWADAVIFGAPTRFGNVPGQFAAFMDSLGGLWAKGELSDKVYAAFTTGQTLHGGQETTIDHLYTSLAHFGGIIVPPGYTAPEKFDARDGNPYGVGHVTGPDNAAPIPDATYTSLDHLARRVVAVADRLTA